jgi:hypothetical protein
MIYAITGPLRLFLIMSGHENKATLSIGIGSAFYLLSNIALIQLFGAQRSSYGVCCNLGGDELAQSMLCASDFQNEISLAQEVKHEEGGTRREV